MKAKNFSLLDQHGATRSLADFAGSWVIVYFYPKDFTPGCTRQACDFRDSFAALQPQGVVVIGVSKDSPSSHAKFDEKHGLGFVLLSDPDLATTKAYGAFGEKNMYGKVVEGVKRSTFLIDPEGKLVKDWKNVKVPGHVEQVMQEIQKAKGAVLAP